jgi:hypothetical protein
LRWRAPSTAADRFEKAELVVVEAAALRRGEVEDAAARAVEGERHRRVGDRLLEAVADRRHARTVGPVQRQAALARLEHPAAQALAEAALADERQVLRRDPAVRGQAQLLALLVLQEDPARPEREAREQAVERSVQHALDVLLAVQPGGDVGEHCQLGLPPGYRGQQVAGPVPCRRIGQFLRHETMMTQSTAQGSPESPRSPKLLLVIGKLCAVRSGSWYGSHGGKTCARRSSVTR